jgi:hypothetical protein
MDAPGGAVGRAGPDEGISLIRVRWVVHRVHLSGVEERTEAELTEHLLALLSSQYVTE